MNKYDRPWLPDELRSDKPSKEKTANKDDIKVEVSPIKGPEIILQMSFAVQPHLGHLHGPMCLCPTSVVFLDHYVQFMYFILYS